MALTQLRGLRSLFDASISKAKLVLDFLGGADWNITNGNKDATITGLSNPINPSDAVTKAYADAIGSNKDDKDSVRVATNAALDTYTAAGSGIGKTLTSDSNGAIIVDSVTLSTDDRILVMSEGSAHVDNGIYTVTATGDAGTPWILTRSTDSDEDAEFTNGMTTFVGEGTVHGVSVWTAITPDNIVVDTTAVQFGQTGGNAPYTAGNGLDLTGSEFSVDVDNSTIEIAANALKVKTDGITSTEILANNVGTSEISFGSGTADVNAGDIGFEAGHTYAGSATNVQDALEELETAIPTIPTKVVGEILSFTNGSPNLTLAHTPIANSEALYVNLGRRTRGASYDYSITGASITMNFNLVDDGTGTDVVVVDYEYNA